MTGAGVMCVMCVRIMRVCIMRAYTCTRGERLGEACIDVYSSLRVKDLMIKTVTHISFTGTQEGMTRAQTIRVRNLLTYGMDSWHEQFVHHGDCVGSDEEMHLLALEYGYNVHLHPPDNPSKKAFCKKGVVCFWPTKPYLKRNTDIAAAGEVLIATPKEYEEVLRSGTWSTIRRARKRGIPIFIIFPDGSRREE